MLLLLFVARAGAQELEPRAYSPAPIGMSFLVLSYAHSQGDVVFDATLPIEDVEGRLNTSTLAYARVFGLLGRTAKADGVLPYTWDVRTDGSAACPPGPTAPVGPILGSVCPGASPARPPSTPAVSGRTGRGRSRA